MKAVSLLLVDDDAAFRRVMAKELARLDFAVSADGRKVGDVRSQVWSPRYQRYLAMAMMRRDYLRQHKSVKVDGKIGNIVDLPFDFDAILKEG